MTPSLSASSGSPEARAVASWSGESSLPSVSMKGEATWMLGVGGAHEARDRCRRQLGMLAVSGRQGSPGGDHEAGARQRLSREPGLDQLEGTVGGRGGGLGKRGLLIRLDRREHVLGSGGTGFDRLDQRREVGVPLDGGTDGGRRCAVSEDGQPPPLSVRRPRERAPVDFEELSRPGARRPRRRARPVRQGWAATNSARAGRRRWAARRARRPRRVIPSRLRTPRVCASASDVRNRSQPPSSRRRDPIVATVPPFSIESSVCEAGESRIGWGPTSIRASIPACDHRPDRRLEEHRPAQVVEPVLGVHQGCVGGLAGDGGVEGELAGAWLDPGEG